MRKHVLAKIILRKFPKIDAIFSESLKIFKMVYEAEAKISYLLIKENMGLSL